MNSNQCQQGDVTLEKINAMPKGFHLVKRTQHGVILAESQLTQNRHFLTDPGVKLFRNEAGEQVIVNETDHDLELKHSASDGAHKSRPVAPGIHLVGNVHEMDHLLQMERTVVD